MTTTRYALYVQTEKNGEFHEAGFDRATKATVVAEADARRVADKVGVQVRTLAGTVVYEASRPAQRVITRKTKPFTKVIDLPAALRSLVPEGYVAAYRRGRNGAIVLRNEAADEELRYAVVDELEGEGILRFAATTREAGAIMKEIGASRRATVDA